MATQFLLNKTYFDAAKCIAASTLFDTKYYLEANSLKLGFIDPIWHYVSTGFAQNYRANPDPDKEKALESLCLAYAFSPSGIEIQESRDLYGEYKNYLEVDLEAYLASEAGKQLFTTITTLRVDIKLFPKESEKLELSFLNADNLGITQPKWMNENKNVGYTFEAASANLAFKFKAVSDCQVKMYFMSTDYRDDAGSRIPIFLNYLDISILDPDGNPLLEELNIKRISHDKKKIIAFEPKADTVYDVQIRFLPNIASKEELLRIMYKKEMTVEKLTEELTKD